VDKNWNSLNTVSYTNHKCQIRRNPLSSIADRLALAPCYAFSVTQWGCRQPKLYQDSHYEILRMKPVPSAWLIIRTRTRSSEIPFEQKRKKTETNQRNVAQSLRLTLCCDVHLVYDCAVFFWQFCWHLYRITGSMLVIALSISSTYMVHFRQSIWWFIFFLIVQERKPKL
jgi:hypothetical protein